MKKYMMFGALFALAAAVFAQPVFDDPRATVIDISAVPGTAKDEIRVINASREAQMSVAVSVYYAKKQRWDPYGTADLVSVDDTDMISSKLSGKLKRYSHVAIVPSASSPLEFGVAKAHNDLYIYVISKETVDDSAFVVDTLSVPGKFKDNVKVKNMSEDSNMGFDVYARKTEADAWQKVGTAFVKSAGDEDFVWSILPDDVANYRFIAVLAHNGKTYAYEASKKNNDLYITVR